MNAAGSSKRTSNRSNVSDKIKCTLSDISIPDNIICNCSPVKPPKEHTIIEFTINGIAFFIYFVCWLVNFWFLVANITLEVIKYFYTAPRFIQMIALILLSLLIFTIAMNLILMNSNESNFPVHSKDVRHSTIIHKYIEYEKMPEKDQAKALKVLDEDESKLFRLIETFSPKLKALIRDIKTLGASSIKKITNYLIASPNERAHLINDMSGKEKEIVNQIQNNLPKPSHFKITVKYKNPNDLNYTQEAIKREFTLTIKDKHNKKQYEEEASIDVRKEDNELPPLEMLLEKILVEDY